MKKKKNSSLKLLIESAEFCSSKLVKYVLIHVPIQIEVRGIYFRQRLMREWAVVTKEKVGDFM